MKPIPPDVVERTWKRIASLRKDEIAAMAQRICVDQPYLLAYLLGVDEDILNKKEREILVYLGTVVFEIMRQGSRPLSMVTEDMLEHALERNLEIVESCRVREPSELMRMAENIMRTYGQFEVLRYVLEALMEDPPGDTPVRNQAKGIIMVHLKTVIDCLDV